MFQEAVTEKGKLLQSSENTKLWLGLTLLSAFLWHRRSRDASDTFLCSTPGYLYYHKTKFLAAKKEADISLR